MLNKLMSFSLIGLFLLGSLTFIPFEDIEANQIVDETRNLSPEMHSLSSERITQNSSASVYYNRTAVYGYANRWWNDRNPNYQDYSELGGDCANFVSQCLIAGGLSLHKGTNGEGYGVYPDKDRPDHSSNGTMPYCDYLHQHLTNYQPIKYTNQTTVNTVPEWLKVGDVVMFGSSKDPWKHAMIVNRRRRNYIGLAAHTNDKWDYPLKREMDYFELVHFYHIRNRAIQKEQFCFEVKVSTLNVRVGPGIKGKEGYYTDIGDVHKGERYIGFQTVVDDHGDQWFHFWYDGRPAWLVANFNDTTYASIIKDPYTMVKLDIKTHSYVRNGPGIFYAKIGGNYAGERFCLVKCSSKWIQFYWRGQKVWSNHLFFEIEDETKPTITIHNPNNETTLASHTVTFQWSGSDNLYLYHYRLKVDGKNWTGMDRNTSHQLTLESGSHSVQIRAIDIAGNKKTVSIYFTINLSPLGGAGWKEEGLLGGIIGVTLIALIGVFVAKYQRKK